MDDKELVARLRALHVWPQIVADNHADILTPRQIENLYAVGNVAHEAADRIVFLLEWMEAHTRKIDDLTAKAEALAEALRKLRDCDWVISLPDRMDAVRDIARDALKAWNENPS